MACVRTGRVEAGKREIKRQLQLADGIMKEDLYTAYHAVSENEEIVADRDVDISGGMRAFSDVMKRQGIKQDGDELYEEFQRIYEGNLSRDADKEKVEDRMQNSGRGR